MTGAGENATVTLTATGEVLVSEKAGRLLGWTPERPPEATLEGLLERVDLTDRDRLRAAIKAVLRGETSSRRLRFRTVRVKGEGRVLEAELSGVLREGKTTLSIRLSDVTDEATARQRVWEEPRLLHTILDAVPLPALVLEEQRVQVVNAAAADLLAGGHGERLAGLSLEQVLGTEQGAAVAEWVTRGRRSLAKPRRGVVLRADGTPTPVELWARLLPTAAGSKVILFLRDLSETEALGRQVEQAARRLAAFQSVVRSALFARSEKDVASSVLRSLAGILPIGAGGVISYNAEASRFEVVANLGDVESLPVPPRWWVNALRDRHPFVISDLRTAAAIPEWLISAREKGWRSVFCAPLLSEEELVGSLVLVSAREGVLSGEGLDLARQAVEPLALGMQYARMRETLRESLRLFEERIRERSAELEEKAAELERLNTALLNLLDDLRATNLRLERATRSLLEMNEDLESFVYTVSHDLRAPLRAIQGFTQAVLEEAAPVLPEDSVVYLRRSLEASQRMEALISDLLEYSRLGTRRLRIRQVELDEVMQEVLGLYEREIEGRKARVFVKTPLGAALADEGLLVQVLGNLLSNALKFVAPERKPRVRIYSELREETVRIWVEDNGIGIPPDQGERIFRVFERLHGPEKYPGTGVGLAIVRRAMERMRGRVGFESAPGRGSRFWIELPRFSPKPVSSVSPQT
ncbi:MAG: ATP-binding protein [candidate division KSB1 bacterium]|nr:ATP-binding protein [candidate division KSB1 bacterium]